MSASPIEMLERAAQVLEPLHQEFVFLGGATVALHLDDPTSPGIRVTKDVDCVVEVATLMEFTQFEEELREHGFEQRLDTDGPICRWSYDELILDIMPANAKILGFSNRWFPEGFAKAEERELTSGRVVLVFDLIHLLATKIEAFEGRGAGDLLGSHDIEDIVMLLDGSSRVFEVLEGDSDVHAFVRTWFLEQLEDEEFLDAVAGHLPPGSGGYGRAEYIVDALEALVRRPVLAHVNK